MSLMLAENDERFGIGQQALMLNGVYAQNGGCTLVADPDPSSAGTAVLKVDSSFFYDGLRYVLASTQTKVGLPFRLWMPFLPDVDIVTEPGTGTSPAVSWRTSINTDIVTMIVRPDGSIGLMNGGPGAGAANLIDVTSGPVLTANAFYHIEAVMELSGTALTYEIRVEGLPVLSGNFTVSVSGPVGQVFWGNKSFAFRSYYYKDRCVWNGGGTYTNDFMGSVTNYLKMPSADVALNWTPSTGATGWQILDNIPPNDAQYITAGDPPPAAYVATLGPALPDNVTSVKGIMTFVRAAKSDGGDASLQVSLTSDGDTSNGADRPITVAQTYWQDIFEIDPATLAPWLPAAVDAVEMSLDRTS